MPDQDLIARVELARRAVGAATDAVLGLYQSSALRVEIKADDSPVTDGDKRANEIIIGTIEHELPEDAILSEESPEKAGTSGYRWVLDPIDGTSSYARGLPTFAILVGIEREGVPVGGVVAMPAIGEALWGGEGLGATWRRRDGTEVPARVSGARDMSAATIEAASATAFIRAGLGDTYLALGRSPRKLRGWSEGLAFAHLATGRIDGAVSLGMSRWDVAAYVPLVEGAGGRLTGWDGSAAVESRRMVGSNGALHGVLREHLPR